MNDFWIDFPPALDWYEKILQNFDFDKAKDEDARDILFSLRKNFDPHPLVNEISYQLLDKQPLFFGAGPNLWRHLSQISHGLSNHRDKYFLVSADGSTNALNLFNIWPDLVVTDLDGLAYEDIILNLKHGAICLIHGHGDNIKQIESFSSLLLIQPRIIATTQTSPNYPVINPGGFTDGDRGIYFLHHLCDKSLPFWLFGYEFGSTIGPFSKPGITVPQSMNKIKQQKMSFLQRLLTNLQKTYHRSLVFYGNETLVDLKIKLQINHSTMALI